MYASLGHNERFNTLRPRQNGRHYSDGIFKCILLNDDVWISLKVSLKFVPKVRINNIVAFVYMMAWRRPCHHLNQLCLYYLRMYASLGFNELNKSFLHFHLFK